MKTFSDAIIRYILREPTDKDKDVISKSLGNITSGQLDLGGYTERLVYGLYRVRKLFEESQYNWDADQINFYKAADLASSEVFETYKLAMSGQRGKAFDRLFTFYFDSGLIKTIIENVDKDTKFYRLRASDDYRLFSDEDMFHIPFEKCHKTSNCRFSITGLPILYFASSVYGCWLETNQPNIEKANVALYEISSDACIKCLSVIMPKIGEKITTEQIKLLPLIVASTMEVQKPNEPFRPEYVIPQLLTECVQKYNMERMTDCILGIKYLSTKRNGEGIYFSGKKYSYLYENYAFPPFEYHLFGVCPKLRKSFILKRNSSIFQDTYVKPQIIVSKDEKERRDEYQNSTFRKLERWLANPQMLTY